jgi:hypothetical protein
MAAMEGIEKEPDIIKPVRQSGPSPVSPSPLYLATFSLTPPIASTE